MQRQLFYQPFDITFHNSVLKCFRYCSIFNTLGTKCVFLVMLRPPLPPCTHLYASELTPPPPLDAYVINGRPHTAKAFLTPKVPYRPHNAKIKVYYLRPICNALRNQGGEISRTNLLPPPRVFGVPIACSQSIINSKSAL